jgi:hypothetical protein
MQVDFFVLDRAPQSFGENVVAGTTAPIHADLDASLLQALNVLWTGEVAAGRYSDLGVA